MKSSSEVPATIDRDSFTYDSVSAIPFTTMINVIQYKQTPWHREIPPYSILYQGDPNQETGLGSINPTLKSANKLCHALGVTQLNFEMCSKQIELMNNHYRSHGHRHGKVVPRFDWEHTPNPFLEDWMPLGVSLTRAPDMNDGMARKYVDFRTMTVAYQGREYCLNYWGTGFKPGEYGYLVAKYNNERTAPHFVTSTISTDVLPTPINVPANLAYFTPEITAISCTQPEIPDEALMFDDPYDPSIKHRGYAKYIGQCIINDGYKENESKRYVNAKPTKYTEVKLRNFMEPVERRSVLMLSSITG